MRKFSVLIILLLACLLFTACGCEHQWTDADCLSPKTCALCGETEGYALSHQWLNADCTAPKTCSLCGLSEGEALSHIWVDASCSTPEACSICGITQGDKLEHTYSDWSFDVDTMSRSCTLCGETETTAMDYILYLTTSLQGRWDCVEVLDELAYNVFGPQVPFLEFSADGSIRFFEDNEIIAVTMEFIELEEYDGKKYYHFLLSGDKVIDLWYVPEDDSLFSLFLEFERLGDEIEGYIEILTGKWVIDKVSYVFDESRKNLDRSEYSVEFYEDGSFTALLDIRIDGAWSILREDIITDKYGTSVLLFTLYDGDYYNTTVYLGITEEKTELGFTRSTKEQVIFVKEN
ncbi:MAG: hypothetical protein E7420_01265 [Ruminococcaceae bacterium]|nr:hypothetical protein [Oscillospiraceae bacterium]